MIKLKDFFKRRSDTIIINNIVFSGLFQGSSFVIPLITTPFLIKILGIENFGILSFVNSFTIYLYTIPDYGFSVKAVREIAINREDLVKTQEIFSNFFYTRIFLCIISFLVVILLISFVFKFHIYSNLFLINFGMVIGRSALPNWYFQGTENIKKVAILNFISQVLSAIFIFSIVNDRNDVSKVLMIQSLSSITIGFIGLYFSLREVGKLNKISFYKIREEIREGFSAFLMNISIISYNCGNLIILGLLTNNKVVGYYSVADKVITFVRQAMGSISGVIFPHICRLNNKSFESVKLFFKNFYSIYILLILAVSLFLFAFATELSNLMNLYAIQGIRSLQILSFTLLFNVISQPPILVLLANNLQNLCTQCYLIVMLLIGALSLFIVPNWGAVGMAFIVLASDIFLIVCFYSLTELKYINFALFKKLRY